MFALEHLNRTMKQTRVPQHGILNSRCRSCRVAQELPPKTLCRNHSRLPDPSHAERVAAPVGGARAPELEVFGSGFESLGFRV